MQPSRGFFDIANKERRIQELENLSSDTAFWNDSERATEVLRERSNAQSVLDTFRKLERSAEDARAALDLCQETNDNEFLAEAQRLIAQLDAGLEKQEFFLKMRGEFDRQNAIIELNGGSGGTEAQDWALMLLRMYIRWAERKGFTVEEIDYQPGEVAGIKSATLMITGEYAYGYLRSEHGVHRLVRISPFDSNARRHTSFASVTVIPDIEEEIEVVIDDKDLRIDTYRSSGAGGQHVNKTDSAVRLTHIPTGIVVACQNERSQHKNKDRAMKILKSKLYEVQKLQQDQKMEEVKGQRKKIDFGSQIRSYVLQPYQMVKDLRTDFETSATAAVLDGEIDPLIESYLLSDLNR